MILSASDKQYIITEAHNYMQLHKLTANALSTKSGINGAYISQMLKGETHLGDTEIGNKWFVQLADFIGLEIEKRFIETEMTPEFKMLISRLEMARDHHTHSVFIAQHGRGKSYTIDAYRKKNPQHTYVVTLDGFMRIRDILDSLCEQLELPMVGVEWRRKVAIIQKLREIRRKGGKPVVIFDEAENAKLTTLQLLKALFDGIKDVAGIVIVGTPQYNDLLKRMKAKNKQGVPQFASRFAANTIYMPDTTESLDLFINKYVSDPGLKQLLQEVGTDYRVLTDYLETALREADKREVPLTEDLFRILNNMPKTTFKRR